MLVGGALVVLTPWDASGSRCGLWRGRRRVDRDRGDALRATGTAEPRTPTGVGYLSLLWHWVARDVHSRYRRSALRYVWAVLQPALTVATYVLIFGVVFSQSGGDLPYLSYLLAGVVVYRVVAGSLSSISCLVDNSHLLSHVNFSREVIPMSRVLGNGVDLVITTAALVVVSAIQGVEPPATLVAVPVVLGSVVVFAVAVCVIGSTIQVFVRDLEFAISFVVMGLFFASPISYQPDQLPPALAWLNWANPISVDVQALRDTALLGRWPEPLFYVHAVLAVLLLGLAVAHLRSIQHRIVDLG